MKKILVVDDEKDVRDLIAEMLSKNKFSVSAGSTAEEAVAMAKTNKPDLILLDIAMPGIDGYQACEMLKANQHTKKIPIVLLTGKDLKSQGVIKHCENLFVAGFISKTASLKDILGDVKKVLHIV